MLCEMCGAESANLESRKISGSVLKVCVSCAGMGEKTTYRESVGHRTDGDDLNTYTNEAIT